MKNNKVPLYNTLLNQISKTSNVDDDINIEQKNDIISYINNLNSNNNNIDLIYQLYMCILEDSNIYENNISYTPYGSHLIKKEITFNLDKFPNRLKHILYNFIKMDFNSDIENRS